jgi:manganese/zinc/iron transport system permease protein
LIRVLLILLLLASDVSAMPTREQLVRAVTLSDYNTRVVVLGTTLLGVAGGVVGSFTLLRKRALMGDALSHATLPGIAIAFLISVAAGLNGRSLLILLGGATVTGVLGLLVVLLLRHSTRIKEDSALGIVLSVFFGLGVALLGIVQQTPQGHAAGLEGFIYGKAASISSTDAWLIAGSAGVSIVVCALMFKELRLLCFDAGYARSQGWPVAMLDVAMMSLVVLVTVVGLQAVGLILVIALLIIPAAAARFWTERLDHMVVIAAAAGAMSGLVGALASALLPNLPSGAMIVLVAGVVFVLSMLLGTSRGVLVRWNRRYVLSRRVRRQHLLRAIYELIEHETHPDPRDATPIGLEQLRRTRAWSTLSLRRELRRAEQDGLVEIDQDNVHLTPEGHSLASRVVRNHRLWEVYLITHADIAPSHVDRDADLIEHVLGADMVRKLESLLADQASDRPLTSPHTLERTG